MNTQHGHLQTAAIICHHVAKLGNPILYAKRSVPEEASDSGWQFLCGATEEDWAQAQVWALHEVLKEEPSLTALINSPVGTVLSRPSCAERWQVA